MNQAECAALGHPTALATTGHTRCGCGHVVTYSMGGGGQEVQVGLADPSRPQLGAGGSGSGWRVRPESITGETSDGYHTFNELYHYRMLYNALLFNEWADLDIADVHKSWRHSDGELCFGGGWFVVMADTAAGQISNHYEAKHWDRFCVPERPTAAEWDGHDAAEAARRMERLLDMAAGKAMTDDERTRAIRAGYEPWWQALWATGAEEPTLTLILVDRNGPDYHPHDPELSIYAPADCSLGDPHARPHALEVRSRSRDKALDTITRMLRVYGVSDE